MRGKRKYTRHRLACFSGGICSLLAVSLFLYTDVLGRIPDETAICAEELKETRILKALSFSSKKLERQKVFAHRGFAENAPDNSFASFDAAIAAGCPQIELDVRTSADGVFYISHDENLASSTGTKVNLSQTSSDELDTLTLENGEKLHRLEEVFQKYSTDIIYLIEFKEETTDETAFYNLVRSYATLASCIQIQSFYPQAVHRIHELLPELFVQVLIRQSDEVDSVLDLDYVDSVGVYRTAISEEIIDTIHESGKEVWAWTVDDPDEIRSYIDMGINGVITNLSSALEIVQELDAS